MNILEESDQIPMTAAGAHLKKNNCSVPQLKRWILERPHLFCVSALVFVLGLHSSGIGLLHWTPLPCTRPKPFTCPYAPHSHGDLWSYPNMI